MAKSWKEWEKPVLELDALITKLKTVVEQETDAAKKAELQARLDEFQKRRDNFIEVRYSRLGAWEEVLLARAEPRPYTLDYVGHLFTEFTELDGDRRIGQDHAIVAGPARLDDRPVMVVGHQKGRDIQQRAYRNFAMSKPEGYRKAIRMFDMAERFRMPVITFVDTPAADPGVESESRGISEAIAASMLKMFELTVPVISVVIGEGGSGGAIGIACANRVLMQQHAIYSVIPPEGCAAILWRDPNKGPQAAAALRLTAGSALEFELVDEVLEEPFGGAHRDPVKAAETVKEAVLRHLGELDQIGPTGLKRERYERFRSMGRFETV
ncbi:MAG TPA: acetyl-CoA carboxylase carboxyltransferase subunit alpha [Fimbriimonadaceae bacterium]|nr:acetyl-CoA carboxylase carboxyltransferase subunit alpha [Fimbriimonadaceae bacterium]